MGVTNAQGMKTLNFKMVKIYNTATRLLKSSTFTKNFESPFSDVQVVDYCRTDVYFWSFQNVLFFMFH